ncbi:hypothetical protein ACWT_3430 [Actinoplanes sp. SE50]|uniref:response regulator n=1 Tax=unclassified Actinoplanes TaxID=2626549 RepID=UPI00023ED442|nr:MULTISPECIES: response regulator [unclassified Actinoplanes]AEV84453.1 hypothetical protein ACPL_3558 [Actinoplanes sp. SE50/110]ATO82845.1 hypothetical protein ACWT_3430 [Actinoplanes sp. SE50]SLM00253.1 hypothetical protein ACSP50_3485 [Actinoplanes sp. SE50/110]
MTNSRQLAVVALDGIPAACVPGRLPVVGMLEIGPAFAATARIREPVVRIQYDNRYHTAPLDGSAAGDVDRAGSAILLSDIMLRSRSDPPIADQWRARHLDLQMVYTSGYRDDEPRRRYDLRAGTGLLQKPFTAVELLAAVGRTLARAASRRS